ncbi:flavin reductase family protein [Erythrobacter sp. JK5]|uniref:flavin reductase family protein n=1 Tax=Erythrobacter sp. JK5 TaxID=2829500 RepID=UPI001BAA8CCD|nr:flavin reductase family protein [Erythrobacter sp. JK5]QUL36900.1 flavin reductase family protein [Erythrobacter sp. JK5]
MRDTASADPVDPAAFRQVMGLFSTGVCIVSRAREDGSPSGITANSFVSVSLDPMLVCWSIQNSSSLFESFTKTDSFAISILAENQSGLARRYASRGDSLMQPADFTWTARGLPVIAGSIGHIECRHWSTYLAGDHTMVFGEVAAIEAREDLRPLGFYAGRFCRIAD